MNQQITLAFDHLFVLPTQLITQIYLYKPLFLGLSTITVNYLQKGRNIFLLIL